jgi:23S rRNA U2552 (ribose-2'-O)-methylase RlmE/FtsJ
MSYYLLPSTSILLYKNIDCINTNEKLLPVVSTSLADYLYEIKEKISKHERDWDIYKKYTNPYEYIHTTIPMKKKCVSQYKPLSRSYFKMIEMINVFNLQYDSNPIRTFHLAEGPGGFIEAISNLRDCRYDTYIGMTILEDETDPNIPAWKKTEYFLASRPNVYIETGKDGTGNILSIDNFVYCKDKYASSMDLITADGGFDFSIDFNSQEINIAKLLFGQIAYAIVMQKKGGNFVLKIFDCFMQHTIDLLYILSSFYNKVYINKPNTSRYANSEKYIICKGFRYNSCDHFYPAILKAFTKMINVDDSTNILRFLNVPISYYFMTKLEEYNSIFGQQQIENIHYTISFIDNRHKQEKIDLLIKNNIDKCVQWCNKYNINHNRFIQEYTPLNTRFSIERDCF